MFVRTEGDSWCSDRLQSGLTLPGQGQSPHLHPHSVGLELGQAGQEHQLEEQDLRYSQISAQNPGGINSSQGDTQ